MTMEISDQRAAEFDKLEGASIKVLQEYLDGKRSGGDDVVTARCILNAVKGNRQTHTARQALQFSMVDSLDDPAVRRRYVEATQPEIRKLLKGSAKDPKKT